MKPNPFKREEFSYIISLLVLKTIPTKNKQVRFFNGISPKFSQNLATTFLTDQVTLTAFGKFKLSQ